MRSAANQPRTNRWAKRKAKGSAKNNGKQSETDTFQKAIRAMVEAQMQQCIANPYGSHRRLSNKRPLSESSDEDDPFLSFHAGQSPGVADPSGVSVGDAPGTSGTSGRSNHDVNGDPGATGKGASDARSSNRAPTLSTSTKIPSATPAANKRRKTFTKDGSYTAQVVILEGVSENLKSNPSKFKAALRSIKPNLEIVSVKKTASGAMLIQPKDPKDSNSLLQKDAFATSSALGQNVKARLPKEQTIVHQVIIRGVDVEVTEDEVKHFLDLQKIPFVSLKRIISRQKNAPTQLMRFGNACKVRS